MKKTVYGFIAVLIMVSGLLSETASLKAKEIISRIEVIEPKVRATFTLDNGSTYRPWFSYVYANEQLTYCLEPLLIIESGESLESSSSLTQALRNELSVISYNGYNVAEGRNDKWYYMATQTMIWERLGYRFTIEGFDNLAWYKADITKRINQFKTLPSFTDKKITLERGVPVTLHDSRKVFSLFKQVVNDGNVAWSRKDNSLTLKSDSNQYEEGNLVFKRVNQKDVGLPIVYQAKGNNNVQEIFYPKIQNNVEGKLSYRVQSYGQVAFTKLADILINSNLIESEYGDIHELIYQKGNLKNVKVNIYARDKIFDVWGNVVYEKDALVETLYSKNEKVLSKKMVAGKYYLKEIETMDGYVLDDKEYEFVITKDKEVLDIKDIILYNSRSQVNLIFKKQFEEGSLLALEDAYKEVVYGIYTKEQIVNANDKIIAPANSLVYCSGIDKDGKLLKETNLPLGSYYLKELATNKHYVIDEKEYAFEIKANGKETIDIKINDGIIMNVLHRNELSILKIDADSKAPIIATFVLYDQSMKEICEFTTDKTGKYVFDQLVDGTYFIQEIKAPKGYKVNAKIHKIELNKDYEITIENEKQRVVNASIDTKDHANHKPIEIGMLSSMALMYGIIFKKMQIV